jgi:hypothetical protein
LQCTQLWWCRVQLGIEVGAVLIKILEKIFLQN